MASPRQTLSLDYQLSPSFLPSHRRVAPLSLTPLSLTPLAPPSPYAQVSGGACTFPLEVTLSANVACDGQECEVDTARTVQLTSPDGLMTVDYEYVPPPCTEMTWFADGQMVAAGNSWWQCADPRAIAAGAACCHDDELSLGYHQCSYFVERTTYVTAQQRCSAASQRIPPPLPWPPAPPAPPPGVPAPRSPPSYPPPSPHPPYPTDVANPPPFPAPPPPPPSPSPPPPIPMPPPAPGVTWQLSPPPPPSPRPPPPNPSPPPPLPPTVGGYPPSAPGWHVCDWIRNRGAEGCGYASSDDARSTTYLWTTRTCATNVQVYAEPAGWVGLVHQMQWGGRSHKTQFREHADETFPVRWEGGHFPSPDDGCHTGNATSGQCVLDVNSVTLTSSCMCAAVINTTAVFSDVSALPSASDIVERLALGALHPDAYDAGTYSRCVTAACAAAAPSVLLHLHAASGGQLDERSIFEIVVNGTAAFLFNKEELVQLGDFSFRNPPHFISFIEPAVTNHGARTAARILAHPCSHPTPPAPPSPRPPRLPALLPHKLRLLRAVPSALSAPLADTRRAVRDQRLPRPPLLPPEHRALRLVPPHPAPRHLQPEPALHGRRHRRLHLGHVQWRRVRAPSPLLSPSPLPSSPALHSPPHPSPSSSSSSSSTDNHVPTCLAGTLATTATSALRRRR